MPIAVKITRADIISNSTGRSDGRGQCTGIITYTRNRERDKIARRRRGRVRVTSPEPLRYDVTVLSPLRRTFSAAAISGQGPL